MAVTTTATKPKTDDTPAPAPEGPLPLVDPSMISINTQGFLWTEYFVRLPEAIPRDMLTSPAIWRSVQKDRTHSLRRFDRLVITDHWQTWLTDATVVDASGDAATLIFSRVITIPTRTKPLFSDPNYAVRWDGAGYVVHRLSDDQKMSETFSDESQAVAHIHRSLYPTIR